MKSYKYLLYNILESFIRKKKKDVVEMEVVQALQIEVDQEETEIAQ